MNGYSERLSEALGQFFGGLAILWLLGIAMLVGIVALITWVVKKVWNAGDKSKQTTHKTIPNDDNWINKAQERQQKRWDYTDPTSKPRKGNTSKPVNESNWYPTGWTWNEKKQLWEPPDYLSQESQERWEWNESSRIWVDKSQMNKETNAKKQEEVRQNWNRYQQENTPKPKVHLTEEEKELANKIHVTREEISFEEWKAAKMAEQEEETTYHYKKKDIVQDK